MTSPGGRQYVIARRSSPSVNPARIAANLDVFDFQLTADQIAALDGAEPGVGFGG